MAMDAKVLTHPKYGEVRFGKTDRIVALPLGGAGAAQTGWIFVGRSGDSREYSFDAYSEEMKRANGLHGQKQRVKDGTGAAPDEAAMFGIMDKMHQQMLDNVWASAGGGGGFTDAVLVDAMTAFTGKPRAEMQEFVKSLSSTERLGVRNDEDEVNDNGDTVAGLVRAIEAKRAEGASKSASEKLKNLLNKKS